MSFELVQWSFASRVSGTAKYLLVFLSHHSQPDGYSWHANRNIADTMGLSLSAIKNSLCTLQDSGLITVNARLKPDGSQTSNLIRVNPEQPLSPSDSQYVLERINPCVVCDCDGTPWIAFNVDRQKYGAKFPTVRNWKGA
jgi:hypothetical protein